MPTTMSPRSPNPPPLTIRPAKYPATAPTTSQITIVSTGTTILPSCTPKRASKMPSATLVEDPIIDLQNAARAPVDQHRIVAVPHPHISVRRDGKIEHPVVI